MAEKETALVIRNHKGQVAPGSPPPAPGRPRGAINTIRGWMKESYTEYCEQHGERANILRFYAETFMNESLDMKLRLEAAKALDRIIFPNRSLTTPEKAAVDDAMAARAKKLAAAFGSAFMEGLPRQIEGPGPR